MVSCRARVCWHWWAQQPQNPVGCSIFSSPSPVQLPPPWSFLTWTFLHSRSLSRSFCVSCLFYSAPLFHTVQDQTCHLILRVSIRGVNRVPHPQGAGHPLPPATNSATLPVWVSSDLRKPPPLGCRSEVETHWKGRGAALTQLHAAPRELSTSLVFPVQLKAQSPVHG